MNKRALIKQLLLLRRRAIQSKVSAGDDEAYVYQKGYIQAVEEAVKLVKMLPSPPLPPMPNDTEE